MPGGANHNQGEAEIPNSAKQSVILPGVEQGPLLVARAALSEPVPSGGEAIEKRIAASRWLLGSVGQLLHE